MAASSPTTETQVCNMALGRIGAQQIADGLLDTEDSNHAIQCRLHYAQTRDALLRSHWWRFAKARVDLAVVTNGDFAHWTSDDPDDWTLTETAVTDEVSEVGSGEGHGGTGTKKCNIYSVADGTGVFMTQTVSTVVGLDYKFSINIDTLTAGEVGVLGLPTGAVSYSTTGIKTVTFTADATSFVLTIAGGTAAATDVTFDDISIYVVPTFEWDYGFTLPTDFLRFKSFYEDNNGIRKNTYYSYELEGNLLMTNERPCQVRYIKQVTTVTDFDELFLEVFILKLAMKMCMPLAQSPKLYESLKDDLKLLMPSVRALDKMEGEHIGRASRGLWNDARHFNAGRIDSRLGSA